MGLIIVLAIVLVVGYGLLLGFYAWGWRRSRLTQALPAASPLPLSVVIPARNEASRIQLCLESLLAQQYPSNLLEIIVVDDHSTDPTVTLVEQVGGSRVRLLHSADAGPVPPDFVAFKKRALAWGIQQASYPYIITLDADCTVAPDWASSLSDAWQYFNRAQMLVLPVRFTWQPGDFLSIFQALDFLSLQGITGAAHGHQLHGMCNGANLSFQRDAFYAVGGYTGIDHKASGDDMLLLQKIQEQFPGSIQYVGSPELTASTPPQASWTDFIQQRIRWASKSTLYQEWQIKAVLLWVYSTNLVLLAAGIGSIGVLLLEQGVCWALATLALVLLKTIGEIAFLWPVVRFFEDSKLLRWFPIAQVPHLAYTVLAGTLGWVGKYRWKGRPLK